MTQGWQIGIFVIFPPICDPGVRINPSDGGPRVTSATVRATFVIDPEGMIRVIIWYPMNVGRSVDELLRDREVVRVVGLVVEERGKVGAGGEALTGLRAFT